MAICGNPFNSKTSHLVLYIRSILLQELHSANFNVKLLWALARVGIAGNEYADDLPRSTYLSPYSGASVCPYSD